MKIVAVETKGRIGIVVISEECEAVNRRGTKNMPRTKYGYCWKCAERFPMSELVEDDDPYIKDETDPNDKNYQCKACEAKDEE